MSNRVWKFSALAIILGIGTSVPLPLLATENPIKGTVVNIVEWEGGKLPTIYERSNQLPLTLDDIVSFSENGFPSNQVVRMVEERRFVGDVSASSLISLKNSGIPTEVLQAVSRHALPPNRALNLSVQLEFEGQSSEARKGYLYIIIPDGDIERVFTANLGSVLASPQIFKEDNTDPLLPKQVRSITFQGKVPLKSYGQKRITIFTSSRPGIFVSSDIPEKDQLRLQNFVIDYPVSSIQQECKIQVRYRRDKLLPYKWEMVAANLQCEWN